MRISKFNKIRYVNDNLTINFRLINNYFNSNKMINKILSSYWAFKFAKSQTKAKRSGRNKAKKLSVAISSSHPLTSFSQLEIR